MGAKGPACPNDPQECLPGLAKFLKTISGATLNIHPEIFLASLPEMLTTHPIYYREFR